MLKRLGRRFYSAKYVYSIQLHKVSPWFMHDRPAKLVWQRGSKKHKRGETAVKNPTHVEGAHVNMATLDVEESFELGVTLYAQSHKTKKSGPYGAKDLKLVIMEVDDDGSIYSILGALTINLNEYAGLMDRKIQVPVECDREITDAVGQPYFDVTIRSWYKQGHGGTSSGISSTGWTAADGSGSEEEEEEHEEVVTAGHEHSDPVKLLDVMDPRKSLSTYPSMDSVPENIQADGTAGQERVALQGETVSVQQMTNQALVENVTGQSTQQAIRADDATGSLAVLGMGRNNVQQGSSDARGVRETEPVMVQDQAYTGLPDEASLISVGLRYHRLSTINSETGEEVMEFMEQAEQDELNKFLEQEIKEEDLGLEAVPSTIIESPKGETTKETGETAETDEIDETAKATKAAETPEATKEEPTTEKSPVDIQPVPVPAVDQPHEDKTPTPQTTEIPSSKTVTATPVTRVPMGTPHRPRSRPRPLPPRRGLWACLPGSGLVCCQPLLPREP